MVQVARRTATGAPRISLSRAYLLVGTGLAILLLVRFSLVSRSTQQRQQDLSHLVSSKNQQQPKEQLLLRSSDTARKPTKNVHNKDHKKPTSLAKPRKSSNTDETGGHNKREKKNEPLDQFPSDAEVVRLRSGLAMPALGFGTCCRSTAKGRAIYDSTLAYLRNGGRLIDTAMAYQNHHEIGDAVSHSGIPRDQLWITSKLSVNRIEPTAAGAVEAVEKSLVELGMDYVDLFLIHSQKLGKDKTIEIWKGLIQAKEKGLVRAIGVSNFNQQEILDLEEATGKLPEVNQIQYHPWTTPEWKELVDWQRKQNIVTTAYNSLGGKRFHKDAEDGSTRTPTWPALVSALATKFSATEIQVMLRWALRQPGVAVIPGATSEEHIRENLNVPRMEDMTDEDAHAIGNTQPPPQWFDPRRGPVKYAPGSARRSFAWKGDHTIKG